MRRKIFLTQVAHIVTHNAAAQIAFSEVKKLAKAIASSDSCPSMIRCQMAIQVN